jgi:uncharacterized protein (DUF1330 family)
MPKTITVFTRGSAEDQVELDRHADTVSAGLDGRPVTLLAAYGPQRVLEGPPVEGVAILEFPDRDAAEGWHVSPAYQRAAQHRFRDATCRGVLVEGRDA